MTKAHRWLSILLDQKKHDKYTAATLRATIEMLSEENPRLKRILSVDRDQILFGEEPESHSET